MHLFSSITLRDFTCRHMRTHTRYELQDSTSIEEGPVAGTDEGGGGGSANSLTTTRTSESPHPGSLGSAAGPSRSISSESADIPMPTHPPPPPPAILQRQQPLTKPPSPMDTEDEEAQSRVPGANADKPTNRPIMERSCTS
jgi:hypothetical protein